MLTHLIYGFFGLMAASVIALAIYLDKPAPEVVLEPGTAIDQGDEISVEGDAEGQEASVAVAGNRAELFGLVKVIDGDTISIHKGGTTETIRFIGINAPETGQCFTNEATQKLKSLLASGSVRLELDASQGERDKYDRLLAYVFTEDGQNAAKVLIEGGFAKEYTYSKAYRYQSEFKAAQAAAQAGGKGLWAPSACAAPAPAVVPAQTQTAAVPAPAETVKTKPVEPKVEEEEEEEPVEEDEEDPPPKQNSSGYTCSSNTYNCTDFTTHAEAQAVYDACGGASNDIHRLDSNKDGQACESLP